MPELPEAETIVRGLRGPLTGRAIRTVEVLRPDLLDVPSDRFSRALEGSRIRDVDRRGKNLVLELRSDEGGTEHPSAQIDPRIFLVVNLGMSGRLLHREPGAHADPPTHPGVRLRLDDGGLLVYHDVRRFGRLRALTPSAYDEWSASMGPEPLSDRFTARSLHGALQSSRTPVRSFLLDQARVAGVGNIYANESLYRAGVHPQRPANELTAEEARRLHRALRTVLREAVEARGTTLRDYRTAQGWRGTYANRLRVYGREDEACPGCGRAIDRIVFGGRSAFVCLECQPGPEA